MAKPNTRPVKVGRFNVTSHAQNKMVKRGIPNEAMIRNLCRKPIAKTPVKNDSTGRPSYKRLNRESEVAINPENKNATTIHPLNDRDAKKYNIDKVHLETVAELEMKKGNKTKK